MEKSLSLDFLVLGSQKAGTTSLHEWLVQHSDVLLPKIKETHFFSHDNRFEKGADWYLAQFPKTQEVKKLKGEIDPEYLYSSLAPARIKQKTNVKTFVIILRNPLERAYSQYLMTVRRGFEDLSFDEALQAESARLSSHDQFAHDHFSYIQRSLYSNQIQRYLDLFPDARFLFVKFDDLVDPDNGKETYKSICDFIGTEDDVEKVNTSNSSNKASTPRWEWLRDFIYLRENKSITRKVISAVISDNLKLKIFLFIDRINRKNIQKNSIPPVTSFEVDKKIISEIENDLDQTMMITGLSLNDWKCKMSGYNVDSDAVI
ncbi:sulfotransferase family protein [Marinobacter sp. SS21]|uniref:sulfotransferase family protein n=1 Tax=Marinobacter sp. SS21 TaxID=2979460 RepID=UPI00232ADBCC|nr:sulfotransferase [Marinobacter sp. SS21]MDC0664157.1 sulfotransferase [Marinobacter sp. SS21]